MVAVDKLSCARRVFPQKVAKCALQISAPPISLHMICFYDGGGFELTLLTNTPESGFVFHNPIFFPHLSRYFLSSLNSAPMLFPLLLFLMIYSLSVVQPFSVTRVGGHRGLRRRIHSTSTELQSATDGVKSHGVKSRGVKSYRNRPGQFGSQSVRLVRSKEEARKRKMEAR